MIKSFLTRLFTSFFVLFIFVGIAVSSFFDVIFELTISLLCVMCVYEAINAIGYSKKKRFLIPSVLYALLVPLSFAFTDQISKSPYYLIIVLSFIYLIIFMLIAMINFDSIKFGDAATLMFVSLVITCFLSNIILLRKLENHGFFYMLLVIVCFAWATDVFAYLVGICIGKHKFSPKISPKKSIEGSVGGTLASVGITALALVIYQNITGYTVDFPKALVYGLLCSIIGQIGDLSFSYIKRSYGIKDFGNLLPGHGGVLDRMDSMIFLAPFFYMLITLDGFIK